MPIGNRIAIGFSLFIAALGAAAAGARHLNSKLRYEARPLR